MLGKLDTSLGQRSTYDAVSQCSRCGFCEQACPTYVATGREAWSGRGRNQIVRMLIEGRLADPASAEEALSTCLLCGACSSVCPAQVPTADLVLEGRRLIGGASRAVRAACRLMLERPGLFSALLKAAYLLKRLGLARLAARTGLLRLLGLGALAEAEQAVRELPRRFLAEDLREDADLDQAQGAAWLYFAPCGPNYLYPRVGKATVRALKALSGRGARLENGCCGLVAYNYGGLEEARAFARANIERLEAAGGQAPLVADCSSCAAHLKSYPQLFLGDPAWEARARAFSARVRDAVEAYAGAALPPAPVAGPVTYHDSCRARNGQGLCDEPRKAMAALAGEAYRELPEAEVCCGGAGAFAFSHPELSEDILRRKAAAIASTGAEVVAASSTSCLLQLADGLGKYYHGCRVVHISELVEVAVEARTHG